jgi:hypothetical protein
MACGNNGAAFCTDLASDNGNCGSCLNKCANGTQCSHSTCVCTLTTCGTQCVDIQTDVNHCGGCNTPCPTPAPNETALCTSGQCSQQCVAPFADCDGNPSNGCEANLQSSSTNCAVCGRTCNGGACSSGTCPVTTYATGVQLGGLAVDASFVYWDDVNASGTISEEAIGGGAPQVVSANANALNLAVDTTRIVWMNGTTALDSRLLSGGTIATLTTFTQGTAMFLAGGYVYFSTTDGTVGRVPEDGSSGAVTITTAKLTPLSLAVDATNVYYADTAGYVYVVSETAQGATAALFASAAGARGIALDTTNVYWTTMTGFVVEQPKGTTTSKNIASSQSQPGPVASDGVNVYWANDGDGSIHRVAVNGSSPLTLATTQGVPGTILVDATNVYWAAPSIVASTAK